MEIDKEEIDSIIKQLGEKSIGGSEEYLIEDGLYERAISGLDMDLLSDLYYNFGLIRFEQNDWQQAIKSFNRSIECSPKNMRDALINLGASKSEQGDQVWALNDYQVAERMGEADDADLLNNIGVSHARLAENGDSQDSLKTAIEYFNRSLVLKPGWEVAQDNLRTCIDTLWTHKDLFTQQSGLKEEGSLIPDALESIKDEILQAIESRMPPTANQIKSFVLKRLGSEANSSLEPTVRENLIKAERYFHTGTDVDTSKLWFCKSVEGTLWHLLGSGYYENVRSRSVRIEVVRHQKNATPKTEELLVQDFNTTALTFWGDLLSALSNTSPAKEYAQQTDFGKYVASNFNKGLGDHLGNLVDNLRLVQSFRSDAAHFPRDFKPEENGQLKRCREIIFGTKGSPSLIKSLVELFKPKDKVDLT